MASVRSIAKDTGVSVATVSRVLNDPDSVGEDTRQKVLAAMEAADYRPEVRKQTTRSILVCHTDEANLSCDYDASLMQGILDHLNTRRFDLLLLSNSRQTWPADQFASVCRSKGVAGILLRTIQPGLDWARSAMPKNLPVLHLGGPSLAPHIHGLDIDSAAATREAVGSLIEQGHRRIAFVSNSVEDFDHRVRRDAYRAALTEAGLPRDPGLEWPFPAIPSSSAQVVAKLYQSKEPPTALFIADPILASGTLLEARKAGLRIPRDLSVIGMDDFRMRFSVYPSLTAVCQDTHGLGKAAIQWMMEAVEKPSAPPAVPTPAPAWLERLESCAAPPARTKPLPVT